MSPGKRKSSKNSDRGDPKKDGSKKKRQRQAAIEDKLAVKIFTESFKVSQDYLKSGRVRAWEITHTDPIYPDIEEFVVNGQAHNFGIRIKTVLEVRSRADTITAFHEDPAYKNSERIMLGHGTAADIVPLILQNGFRCPALNPPKQMFGSGIYFADRLSKCALYCKAGCLQATDYKPGSSKAERVAWIILSETLPGRIYHSPGPLNTLTAAPAGYDSVKGTGQKIPDSAHTRTINGCQWALGPTIDNTDKSKVTTTYGPNQFLRFNEYVLYESWRIQPKYLLQVIITPRKQSRKKKGKGRKKRKRSSGSS